MNHFGILIREYRESLGISRKELSEGICTEKYIYLIEKGDRTPSVDILSVISERLGVDLFDYYQYLGCNNPIVVRDALRQFNICRRKFDFIELEKITNTVIQYPDFKSKPWLYEIEVNYLFINIFKKRNYIDGKEKIINLLNDMEAKYSNSYYALFLYTLLTVCYEFIDDLTSAKETLQIAERIIDNKENIDKFNILIIAVKVCSISTSYHSGEYELVIQKGNEFLLYLYSLSVYLYIYYAYFYLSFAYYNLGKYEEASEYFKKGFNSLMVEDKQTDVNILYEIEEFKMLLYRSNLKQYSIDEFLKRYKLI
ncbi:helix-turn-helix domain-containing protein [Lachnoclostridium phytofermentans]|uniref:Transcriptional regulator, XRE family n=1 Tax=Lachnoclostridium phytofermentans (strain ATCC 700394 / DSM 18823 / ISDg) TaxID=357809 RepID=A9KQL5_LACP7|nr:helix-turn-helix transcriptional regulator [Lachnoclostridium phytofermentans]ABX41928.1 transcriptional regulator, XRE family [Lachnoclostridium phytofermentans ISDg]